MGFGSDPLKRRARALDREEKALADHLATLRDQLDQLKNPQNIPAPPPPVWRASRESDARRVEREAVRRAERVHGAQRRRDRARFIVLALGFLTVLFWLAKLLR